LFAFESLCNLFKEMADLEPCQGEIRCIIDGLDACEDFPGSRKNLLLFVKKISRLFDPKLHPCSPQKLTSKILLVSRPIAPLKNHLADIPRMDLDAEAEALQKSIDTFVSSMMNQGQIRSWKDGTLRQAVTDMLLEKAAGTFLWVGPLAKAVATVESRESDTTLASLPDSLVEFYSRMLPLGTGSEVKESYQILGYIAVACRPLKLEELAIFTNTPIPQAPAVTSKSQIEDKVESCGQLLKFDQVTSTVALIHESAREFLLGKDYCPLDRKSLLVSAQKANAEMGTTCLAVVMDWAKEVANERRRNTSRRISRPPLLDYAIKFWLQHYSLCTLADLDETALSWINKRPFWTSKQSPERRIWLDEYWRTTMSSLGWTSPKDFQMIHAAAFFGVPWLTQHIVRKSWRRLDAETSRGMTPLHWAARNGHLEVVKVLLGYPSVNIEAEGYKMTPLIWAVHNLHHDIVELLLQKGARIDAVGFGMTALHWSAWVEDKRMIALLLKAAEKNEKHLEARTVPVKTARLLPSSHPSHENQPSSRLSWVLPQAQMLLNNNIMMSEAEIYKRNTPQTRTEREIVAQDMEIIEEKEAEEMKIQRGEKTVVVFAMSIAALVAMVCLLATIAWKAIEPLFHIVGWKTETWLLVIVSLLVPWILVAGLWWTGHIRIASKLGVATSAAWSGFTAGWSALCSFAFAMGEGPAIVELRVARLERTQTGYLLSIASKRLASSFKQFTRGRDGYIPPPTFEDIVKKASLVLLQGTMRWVLELTAWAFALILGLWWAEKGGSHSVVWALLLTSWVLVVVWEATVGLATATKAEDTSAWTLIATGSITMTVAGYSALAGAQATLAQSRSWRSKLRYASATVAISCVFAVGCVAIEPIPRLKNKIPLRSIGMTSFIISALLAMISVFVAEMISRCLEAGKNIWYHVRPDFQCGHTPLHLAAITGNKTTVEMLLKAGADPWARDYNKQTAHWLAIKACFRDVVEVLEEAMKTGQPK
jgi:ankyrin repeat protein